MGKPYIIACRFPDDLKIILARIKNGLITVLSHDIRKFVEQIVDIDDAHLIFLEIPPAFPVECDRKVDLLAVKNLKEFGRMLMEHINGAVRGIVIYAYLKACSLCIRIILLKLTVCSQFVIVIDHGSEIYELAAGSLDLVKIDIALISGDVNAVSYVTVGISCHEIAVFERRVGVRAPAAATAGVARLIDLNSHIACLGIARIIGQSDRNGITPDRGSIDLAFDRYVNIRIAVVDVADMLLDIEFIAYLDAY